MIPERLGPYRIEHVIGRGGMGAVYQGVNLETNQPAAIKILAARLAQESDFRQRFETEIETLRKLNHPNIVRLFGFGQQDDLLYFAMELVDGSSLEEELLRGRRFDWREVTCIGIEVCRALRHAHDRGVIHRDIKPANLLLARDNRVKLSDFGIARLFGITGVTAAGNVLGTIEYMAPEQVDSRPATPRTDLYSLGGVFFALLARRPPFRARSVPEMLDLQRRAVPEPVSRFAPDVPRELELIISQLLEKDPEKRVPTAKLLGRRLEAMLHALSLAAETDADAGPDDEAPRTASPPTMAPDAGQIPPTRLIGDSSDQRRLATTGATPCPPDELPETRVTTAFHALAARALADSPRAPADTAEEVRNHFTPVDKEEPERPEPAPVALISLHTWILAAALVAVGLATWYLLRPPSADALYDQIMAIAADRSIDSLRKAEPKIGEFLARYSTDSRSSELHKMLDELELYRLERRFELRARGLESTDRLLPIERTYLEAISYGRLSPELGIVKLRALIDLYDHRTDRAGPTGQCLELARRQLERFREQLAHSARDHVVLLEERLDRADQLSQSDPERARAMREALIELHRGKPWAAAAVRRAEAALAALGGGPGPKSDPKDTPGRGRQPLQRAAEAPAALPP